MTDPAKPNHWWQTVPGALTAIAGILTALTGLIIAIQKTGWFADDKPPTVIELEKASSSATQERPGEASGGSQGSAPPTNTEVPQLEAALRDAVLFGSNFKILKLETTPKNLDALTIKLQVRMTNNGRYDANFGEFHFRLLVDSVPRAPISGLNLVVAAQAAREGNVVFEVPRSAQSLVLMMGLPEENVKIPLRPISK
jgi:hypothetical protein